MTTDKAKHARQLIVEAIRELNEIDLDGVTAADYIRIDDAAADLRLANSQLVELER